MIYRGFGWTANPVCLYIFGLNGRPLTIASSWVPWFRAIAHRFKLLDDLVNISRFTLFLRLFLSIFYSIAPCVVLSQFATLAIK